MGTRLFMFALFVPNAIGYSFQLSSTYLSDSLYFTVTVIFPVWNKQYSKHLSISLKSDMGSNLLHNL